MLAKLSRPENLAIDGTSVSSWCNCYAKEKSDKDDCSESKHVWYGYNVELVVDTKADNTIANVNAGNLG